MARRVLVIGIGSFGTALVETLHKNGAEVIVIDENAASLEGVKDLAAHAVVADGTDPRVLQAVEASSCDVAVVTFGEDFEASVLAVAALKKLSVREIAARAVNQRQQDVLLAVGATRVIQLEIEGGRRLADEIVKR
jgi:trk system potassium uptake protein TrkA